MEVTGGPVPLVPGVGNQYALSDSGSLVFVPGGVGGATDRTLAIVDRNGVVEPLNVPPKDYLSPRLSPDGQTLTVESIEGDGSVIWVYDLSGETAIQQLTFEGDNQWPIWTPGGQQITFSSDRDGTLHWSGSWSPDGQTLLFHVVREDFTDWDIWRLSDDSGETESLYGTPDTSHNGTELSPDGKWLAYGARPPIISDVVDIYVEPFPPTGARRRISQNGGYWPLWSPDGSELFYRPTVTSGERTLRSVDIVTEPDFGFSNEQTLPIQGFIVVARHRDYDITPNGEQFLMVFPADQADSGEPSCPRINIVLNWFEELKERVPVP